MPEAPAEEATEAHGTSDVEMGEGPFGEFGQEAPQTPSVRSQPSYSPTPPVSSPAPGEDESMMVAEDAQPLIDLCAVDRGLARDVARDSREILKLVQALGGPAAATDANEPEESRRWSPRCTAPRA